jgi:hypothetical protein
MKALVLLCSGMALVLLDESCQGNLLTSCGRRGDGSITEEGGGLSLLCLLHVFIHLVCYNDNHCLILKFPAPLFEMVSLEE